MRDRREEQSKYRGDVTYEVWRRGGNSDLVDYDRVRDYFDDGIDSDRAASAELRRQRPTPPMSEQEDYEQEDYDGGLPDDAPALSQTETGNVAVLPGANPAKPE